MQDRPNDVPHVATPPSDDRCRIIVGCMDAMKKHRAPAVADGPRPVWTTGILITPTTGTATSGRAIRDATGPPSRLRAASAYAGVGAGSTMLPGAPSSSARRFAARAGGNRSDLLRFEGTWLDLTARAGRPRKSEPLCNGENVRCVVSATDKAPRSPYARRLEREITKGDP